MHIQHSDEACKEESEAEQSDGAEQRNGDVPSKRGHNENRCSRSELFEVAAEAGTETAAKRLGRKMEHKTNRSINYKGE